MNKKPKKKKNLFNARAFLFGFIIIMYVGVFIYSSYRDTTPVNTDITYNEMIELIESGKVEKINVTKTSDTVTIKLTDGTSVEAVNPKSDTFIEDLLKLNVNVEVQADSRVQAIISLIGTIPLVIVMSLLSLYIINTIVGGNTKHFTLLKTKNNQVTFDSIQGLSEVKTEIKFIVKNIKNWKQLNELGTRPCKGVLLYGPPGTGKTMIAKAIAKEAGINFISCSGSDFNEVFAGVGAARVRRLWELAETNTPCIIFIDEIDCLGRRRKGGDSVSTELNQTINSLLQKMDGINSVQGITVIGATNRKDDLDKALLRPGRFDRQYYIGPPDNKKDRDEIVNIYLKNKKVDEEVTLEKVSKLLVGFTGAEIENALSEAVYNSMMENRDGIISLKDIDKAVMRHYTAGIPKEHSSEFDRRVSAYHEAGHTLVNLLCKIPVAVVSIQRYSSGAGGITRRDLDLYEEKQFKLFDDYKNDIKMILAGKVAEEIILGQHTQGCSKDIEDATKLIYSMITELGFYPDHLLNTRVLIENGLAISLEESVMNECNKLLEEFNKETFELLSSNKELLDKLIEKLLKDTVIVMPTLEELRD